MLLATGLFALALLGGDRPATAPSPSPERTVRLQVRLLDMKGIEWRGSLHERLVPAARQGTCSVWTANRDVIESLQKSAEKTVTAPAVIAEPGKECQVRQEASRRMVANLRRVADGPPGKNTLLAFEPEVDEVRDAFEATMNCRFVDQGILAEVGISDTHLVALHTCTIQDGVTNTKDKNITSVNAPFQVAEVVSGEVQGEWLIPTNGVLVVSFGAYTASDDKGRAVVRERIAIIEPTFAKTDPLTTPASFGATHRPSSPISWTKAPAIPQPMNPPVPIGRSMLMAPPMQANDAVPACEVDVRVEREPHPSRPAPGTKVVRASLPLPITPLSVLKFALSIERRDRAPMPVAMPPSRGLPRAVAVDGSVVDLPPLPDDAVEPASTDDSDEPRPAPQAPRSPQVFRLDTRVSAPSVVVGQRVGRPGDRVVIAGTTKVMPIFDGMIGQASLNPIALPTIKLVPMSREPASSICGHTAVTVGSSERFPIHVGTFGAAPEDMPCLRPFLTVTPSPAESTRVTNYEARGNTLVLRDPKDGKCKLVCDDLVMTSSPFDDSTGCVFDNVLMKGTGADATCESCDESCGVSDLEAGFREIAKRPIHVLIPIADGSVVEVTARVVKKASAKSK